jgi:hypothetical protein
MYGKNQLWVCNPLFGPLSDASLLSNLANDTSTFIAGALIPKY